MIGVHIKTVTASGVMVAETSARSIVDFESQFDSSVISLFTGTGKMSGIYWLAWRSLQLAGKPVGEFDQWVDALVDFEVIEGAPPLPPPPVQ